MIAHQLITCFTWVWHASHRPKLRMGLKCLAVQAVAERLGRWSPGGASAERMYRTLTDPGYQKTTNKHGRRLNARCGTPMCGRPLKAWAC